jgi:hypothetical protein
MNDVEIYLRDILFRLEKIESFIKVAAPCRLKHGYCVVHESWLCELPAALERKKEELE